MTRRLGLSQMLFWRVAGVLALAMAAMLIFTQIYYQKQLYGAWKRTFSRRPNGPRDTGWSWMSMGRRRPEQVSDRSEPSP